MGLVFHRSLAIVQDPSSEQYLIQRTLKSENKHEFYDPLRDADVGPSNITGEYCQCAIGHGLQPPTVHPHISHTPAFF